MILVGAFRVQSPKASRGGGVGAHSALGAVHGSQTKNCPTPRWCDGAFRHGPKWRVDPRSSVAVGMREPSRLPVGQLAEPNTHGATLCDRNTVQHGCRRVQSKVALRGRGRTSWSHRVAPVAPFRTGRWFPPVSTVPPESGSSTPGQRDQQPDAEQPQSVIHMLYKCVPQNIRAGTITLRLGHVFLRAG
jgi:hypothetical protein